MVTKAKLGRRTSRLVFWLVVGHCDMVTDGHMLMSHSSPCHFFKNVREKKSVLSVWLKACIDTWLLHKQQKDDRHSYLVLAVQFLGKAKGAQFLENCTLDVFLPFSLKKKNKFLVNKKGCTLPSSSDTSKISSTVSGKLIRCFSVVDWKADIRTKINMCSKLRNFYMWLQAKIFCVCVWGTKKWRKNK